MFYESTKMKHIDLFSGIGGFAYAIDTVWENVEHIFCDNEPFSQQVLRKHWPNAPIFGDIRTLTTDPDKLGRVHGEPQIEPTEGRYKTLGQFISSSEPPFILTGGFPCQPFSAAGKRKGTADDRHLWPEMLRIIQEVSPRWIVGENVGGLVNWSGGLVFEQVQADLENEGYEVQSFILPAVAVNAPHRRDRIWIVANRRQQYEPRNDEGMETSKTERTSRIIPAERSNSWNQNWLEVATRLCRVDDGLPPPLDRNKRLKALGNAIVPQVAIEIMKAIKKIEE
jgi:DNA (cytosine-5)-methyltransferase 1